MEERAGAEWCGAVQSTAEEEGQVGYALTMGEGPVRTTQGRSRQSQPRSCTEGGLRVGRLGVAAGESAKGWGA